MEFTKLIQYYIKIANTFYDKDEDEQKNFIFNMLEESDQFKEWVKEE